MWKKTLPFVFLVALVVYGVYDYIQNHTKSEAQQTHNEIQQQTHIKAKHTHKKSHPEQIEKQQPKKDEAQTANGEIGLAPGYVAPDFSLQTLKGKSVKLSDFRGKNVIVNFWATWCPPCRVEAPELEKYYKANKNNDFTILAVDLTGTEKNPSDVKGFVDDHGLTFPVLLDTDNNVSTTYRVMGYPTSYFIDKKGVIHRKVVGAMNENTVKQLVAEMN